MVFHRHEQPCFLRQGLPAFLLCFFCFEFGSWTKKEGDISMIRDEEQVFPTLTYRHTEEGIRTGVRGFPRSLYNNYLKEKDNDKNYYDWTNRNDKGRT